jgi:DNA-binding transcriptional ArsR family regulator
LTVIFLTWHIQPMLQTFSALADPNRLRIVELLLASERSVNELVSSLGLKQPHVSKQLKVLREAGVVKVTAKGQQRLYALEPEPMRAMHAYLERYRALWEARFDAMDEVVKQLEEEEEK